MHYPAALAAAGHITFCSAADEVMFFCAGTVLERHVYAQHGHAHEVKVFCRKVIINSDQYRYMMLTTRKWQGINRKVWSEGGRQQNFELMNKSI